MSTIFVRGVLRVVPGREAALEEWIGRICEKMRVGDPGTIFFEFARDDQGRYLTSECYADSDAAIGHFHNVEALLAELLGLIEDSGVPLEVWGDPSPELRAHYDEWGPVYMTTIGRV
jgi:quinol monooxygenase YgiN